jgi:hypothetical protein
MKNNKFTNKMCFGLIILTTIAITLVGHYGVIKTHSQSSTTATAASSMATMNNTIITTTTPQQQQQKQQQQHAAHTFDNLTISEHIPLTGQLTNGDYILLMDFTPFSTSIEGHSHIAMKVPCNEDGSPKVTIVTGVAPNLKTLDVGNAINNGTLDGKSLDLSDEGISCLYHAELPNGTTDIALVNTSNQTLNFDDGGGYYSVTVSAHGIAIQHHM